MTKKLFFILALFCATALASVAADGFHHSTHTANITTVEQAKHARDDTRVTLHGFITSQLRDEKYEFKDDTGTIICEIDHHVWRGVSIDEHTHIEIIGEVDRDHGKVKIEVARVTVLPKR
jgi:uncharacterized protein (TIGR00156 family)